MSRKLRVLHYLNQFFGGIGGEEHAYAPVEEKEGPVGPGRVLQAVLGDRATLVSTVVAGDNYFTEELDSATAATDEILDRVRPDVVVAGPAFDAGRYGLACAEVCRRAALRNIPAVTGMHPENPGVLTYRREILAVSTGTDSSQMAQVVGRMAELAVKVAAGDALGPAPVDGYVPRGVRRPVTHEKFGYERATEMLLDRLSGRPWTSEMLVTSYEDVASAPPVNELREAVVGLVSSGGLVPRGNEDRLTSTMAETFFRYDISAVASLSVEDWESVHGGFSTQTLNTRDPNYAMPLDTVRYLEDRGVIRGVYPQFFTTTGNGTAVRAARRMGSEIAAELRENGVDAVLLVAT